MAALPGIPQAGFFPGLSVQETFSLRCILRISSFRRAETFNPRNRRTEEMVMKPIPLARSETTCVSKIMNGLAKVQAVYEALWEL